MDQPPEQVCLKMERVAIVLSHPIQYYAPWFRHLAAEKGLLIRVYYLWDISTTDTFDKKFGRKIKWDLDLLSGYESEQVENIAKNPGTSRFNGLDNPKLLSRLRSWKPDAILCFGYGWKTMWYLAKSWHDCPLILRGDSHHLGRVRTNVLREKVRGFILRRLFHKYAAFACVGRANQKFYEIHGVASDQIFHVPHSVDNERFAASTELESRKWRSNQNITQDSFLILFAGKFEAKKRPDLLIKAFKQANLSHAHLMMVGSGQMEAELRSSAGDLGDLVIFSGFLNQSEMPAALSAADLVVLPSEGSGETWGLIINEAMACGTPVVVSDHVGCAQDLIIENETGWVFRAGESDHLSECLRVAQKAITENPEKFAKSTRQHISNYSYESATKGLLDMLATLSPISA